MVIFMPGKTRVRGQGYNLGSKSRVTTSMQMQESY